MKRFGFYSSLFAIAALTLSCMQPPTAGGGGSEVEVVGVVYMHGSEPAPATQVKLILRDYDPTVMAPIADSMIDTSDAQGRYSFRNVAPGSYNVQALQLEQRTRMLVTGVEADSGTVTVHPETLREPGAIRLLLLDCAERDGFAIIPGTEIAISVPAGRDEILLDSVPAGNISEVRYKVLDDTTAVSILDVAVGSAATTTLYNPSWRYRRDIVLNTSNTGAGTAGDVFGFPVLVRLTGENFDFARAEGDGSDIRFTSSHGFALPHAIERWDSGGRSALLWVKADTVRGGDSTQFMTMYWGNPDAPDASNGEAVFDTAAGFQGVWHLDENGNDPALDATANRFNGTAYDMLGDDSPAEAPIGSARSFDGSSSYITMPNTAGGKLNFGTNDHFSVSAWVYIDSFDDEYRTILSKGYRQYFLQVTQFPRSDLWQFSVFGDTSKWIMSHTEAAEKQWVFLTAVRSGTEQDIYCNGELVVKNAVTSQVYSQPETYVRDTTDDFTIGRFFKEATFPVTGYCHYRGAIDEVRVCSVARGADWIRLCYMNQRSDDRLLRFR